MKPLGKPMHDRLTRFFLCGDFGPGSPRTYVALVDQGYVSEAGRKPTLTPKGREYCEHHCRPGADCPSCRPDGWNFTDGGLFACDRCGGTGNV